MAAKNGHLEIVKKLIEAGADVNSGGEVSSFVSELGGESFNESVILFFFVKVSKKVCSSI